jgi:hypothetical protein
VWETCVGFDQWGMRAVGWADEDHLYEQHPPGVQPSYGRLGGCAGVVFNASQPEAHRRWSAAGGVSLTAL